MPACFAAQNVLKANPVSSVGDWIPGLVIFMKATRISTERSKQIRAQERRR